MIITKEEMAYRFLKTRFANVKKDFFPTKEKLGELSKETNLSEELVIDFFKNFLGYKNDMSIGKQYVISYKIVQVIFKKENINFSKEVMEKIAKEMNVDKKDFEEFNLLF